jgi:hypothetical protein
MADNRFVYRNKVWQAVEYLTFVEVVPVDDDREHLLGDECWCNPTVEIAPNEFAKSLITHHSHDGREQYE